jgi:NAD(P)-dependent dehydrogenase (short-subunit alcohol dehydrogenase family)
MMTSMEGRRVLISGASQNLGERIARRFAFAGASVGICAHRSVGRAQALADELEAATGRPHPVLIADLGEPEGAESLAVAAEEAFDGRVDILVNNVGPFSITPFLKLPTEEWRRIMDANLTAAFVLARELVPPMKENGWGRIVNLSAGSAYLVNHASYGLAKQALGALTASLALEAGPEVTVNAVAPGQIEESAPDITAIDPTFVARALARTPAGRFVRRDEVAEVVLALCTPTFALVTGAVLPLDGGWRLNRF